MNADTRDPESLPDPVCVCGHPKSGHVAATPTQLVCVAVGMDLRLHRV